VAVDVYVDVGVGGAEPCIDSGGLKEQVWVGGINLLGVVVWFKNKKLNVYFTSGQTRHFSPAGSSDAHTPTSPGEVATPVATREWQC